VEEFSFCCSAVGVTWRVVFSLVFSFLGFCPRELSALRASLVRPFEFTCGVLRICSVCCAHAWFVLGVAGKQYAQATLGGEPPFRNGVIGALPLPFGWLPTAQCIEGSRRSTVINLCRPLWRALASGLCCRGSRLIYQQVSLPPPGGTPERSAPFQKCGLALLSQLTVLPRWSSPLSAVAASALPEESTSASCEENSFQNFLSDRKNKSKSNEK